MARSRAVSKYASKKREHKTSLLRGIVSSKPLGPPPPPSSATAHNVMVANRGRDTGLERTLRASLREAGLGGYRVNYQVGRTRIDIAYLRKKLAVNVHGCFWHHCPVCDFPVPKSHGEFWARKFALNQERDVRVRTDLTREGWRVIEFWEHEVRDDLGEVIDRLRALLNAPAQAI